MKKQFEDIEEAIKDAATIAIAESKALKLSITYVKNGKVITEHPDGNVEVLDTIEESTASYKKGQKLYIREND